MKGHNLIRNNLVSHLRSDHIFRHPLPIQVKPPLMWPLRRYQIRDFRVKSTGNRTCLPTRRHDLSRRLSADLRFRRVPWKLRTQSRHLLKIWTVWWTKRRTSGSYPPIRSTVPIGIRYFPWSWCHSATLSPNRKSTLNRQSKSKAKAKVKVKAQVSGGGRGSHR